MKWQHTINAGTNQSIQSSIFALAFIVFFPLSSFACFEPTKPSFYGTKPIEPTVPYCVNQYAKTHTCDDFTIDSYNNALRDYRSAVQRYNLDLDAYVSKWKQYVDEAVDFAKCEIKRVSSGY